MATDIFRIIFHRNTAVLPETNTKIDINVHRCTELIFFGKKSLIGGNYENKNGDGINLWLTVKGVALLFCQTVHPDNPASTQAILGNHGPDNLQIVFQA